MALQKHTANIVPINSMLLLSVVVPVYNEQDVVIEFHRRLTAVLQKATLVQAEIIYINDGSTDKTSIIIQKFMCEDHRVQMLELSRNFGKEAAMTAGLDHASGDAVIFIDADLQDPPELIPQMIQQWRNGYDVVNMRRLSRTGENRFKRSTASLYYKIMARTAPVEMPAEVGDFRLLSRRTVEAIRQLPERTRVMKGLFAWIGFPTTELTFHRDARHAGKTKWNFLALCNLAMESITSFTVAPLKFASYAGVFTSLAAFTYSLLIFTKTLISGDTVPGYPSLLVTILFLGGLQLLAIGLVGEYIGRIFIESKQRPIYVLKQHHAASRISPQAQDLNQKQL